MLGNPARQEFDAATVRIASVSAIPAVLRQFGVDPQPLLQQAGLDVALFDDPEGIISFAARSRLVQLCVECTGCRHFGLLVGAQNGLQTLGLLGLLMKYSPDVRCALRSLVSHLHLHGRGGMTSLTEDQGEDHGRAVLVYQIDLPRSVATDQIGDGSVAFMFNILRELCGPGWLPQEARFAHRRPKDFEPYRRLLQAPLRFDAPHYELVFDADDLSLRLPRHDPALHRYLQQQIDRLEAEQADDLPRQVRMALRQAFADRRYGAERIAPLFAMHVRTLHRRLRDCGTGFRALVDETRFEMARQLLRDSARDPLQIAELLGYADAGAFARAFRRWSGVTPSQWRARQAGAEQGNTHGGS